MHHLDPAGRYGPSSLDVSRAAADRHAISYALRQPSTTRARSRPGIRHRPLEWIQGLVASLS